MKTEAEIKQRLNGLFGAQALLEDSNSIARVDAGIKTLQWILGEM